MFWACRALPRDGFSGMQLDAASSAVMQHVQSQLVASHVLLSDMLPKHVIEELLGNIVGTSSSCPLPPALTPFSGTPRKCSSNGRAGSWRWSECSETCPLTPSAWAFDDLASCGVEEGRLTVTGALSLPGSLATTSRQGSHQPTMPLSSMGSDMASSPAATRQGSQQPTVPLCRDMTADCAAGSWQQEEPDLSQRHVQFPPESELSSLSQSQALPKLNIRAADAERCRSAGSSRDLPPAIDLAVVQPSMLPLAPLQMSARGRQHRQCVSSPNSCKHLNVLPASGTNSITADAPVLPPSPGVSSMFARLSVPLLTRDGDVDADPSPSHHGALTSLSRKASSKQFQVPLSWQHTATGGNGVAGQGPAAHSSASPLSRLRGLSYSLFRPPPIQAGSDGGAPAAAGPVASGVNAASGHECVSVFFRCEQAISRACVTSVTQVQRWTCLGCTLL